MTSSGSDNTEISLDRDLTRTPNSGKIITSLSFLTIMANPRKFSEKIALHNQKQAEETAAFEAILRDVSAATRGVSPISYLRKFNFSSVSPRFESLHFRHSFRLLFLRCSKPLIYTNTTRENAYTCFALLYRAAMDPNRLSSYTYNRISCNNTEVVHYPT